MKKKLFIIIAISYLLTSIASATPIKPHLNIVAYQSTPFMMFSDQGVHGFSKDLLDELSSEMDFNYTITQVDSISTLLNDIKEKKGDLGLTSVSITAEREAYLDFSYSFYDSGLDILIPYKNNTLSGTIETFLLAVFSKTVGIAVLAILALLLLAAHVIWFCERDKNIGISRSYVRGIFESLWWATVTVTTVGYGDKAPVSYVGRSFAMVWMFTGILFISLFTASITSSMTLNQIKDRIRGPQDLPLKMVGTVQGTTSEDYLHNIHAIPVLFPHIDDALAAFKRGEIEAVVYDQPILKYYEITKGKGTSKVIGNIFDKQQYGIALPENSSMREPLNQAILKLKESGRYDKLMAKWFK